MKELGVFWVTLVLGFRSDLSIICKTDRNFGNLSAGVLFSKVAKITKTVVNNQDSKLTNDESYDKL